MNPWTGAILSLRVVGDDVDARYAYPSVRRLTSGIRVVPRKESVPLLKRRGFFHPKIRIGSSIIFMIAPDPWVNMV